MLKGPIFMYRHDSILRSIGGTLERFRRGFITPLEHVPPCPSSSSSFPSSFWGSLPHPLRTDQIWKTWKYLTAFKHSSSPPSSIEGWKSIHASWIDWNHIPNMSFLTFLAAKRTASCAALHFMAFTAPFFAPLSPPFQLTFPPLPCEFKPFRP